MNWIDINEQLPPDNNDFGGKTYIVTIVCDSWEKSQTMIMNWECKKTRGKEVKRWNWNNRPTSEAWKVTHLWNYLLLQ